MANFKTHFIMAYHKLKKQSKNQVNNMMTGGILELIAEETQKIFTQYNKSKEQLANFAEANKTLKELVGVRKKKNHCLG